MNEKTRQELDAYYTPNKIVKDMVSLLDINENCRVYDPMCGDGRLLRAVKNTFNKVIHVVGHDIDEKAIKYCKTQCHDEGDIYEVRDVRKWGKETFDCDIVVMNPNFHSPICENAIYNAIDLFDTGVIYMPFDKVNIEITQFSRAILREYKKDFLEQLFDCEIKYRQGFFYWRKKL